jgi:hypothetical protein
MSMRAKRSRGSGQALVEFATTLSLFAVVVLVIIQLGILFVTYYSETRMARETARWLAVNRNATDAQLAAHVHDTLLPGLVNGTPVGPTGVTCGSDVPGCTEYSVGNMVIQFTPCTTTGSTSGCDVIQRAPGNTLYVKMTYYLGPDANHTTLANTGLLFLPSTLRIGSLAVGLPQSLPGYKVSIMVE